MTAAVHTCTCIMHMYTHTHTVHVYNIQFSYVSFPPVLFTYYGVTVFGLLLAGHNDSIGRVVHYMY